MLGRDLLKLLGSNMFSDLTFQVENRTVPAHSIILTARSDTFKFLFLQNIETNALKIEGNTIIVAPIITFKSFTYILELIYSNEIWAQPQQRYMCLHFGVFIFN